MVAWAPPGLEATHLTAPASGSIEVVETPDPNDRIDSTVYPPSYYVSDSTSWSELGLTTEPPSGAALLDTQTNGIAAGAEGSTITWQVTGDTSSAILTPECADPDTMIDFPVGNVILRDRPRLADSVVEIEPATYQGVRLPGGIHLKGKPGVTIDGDVTVDWGLSRITDIDITGSVIGSAVHTPNTPPPKKRCVAGYTVDDGVDSFVQSAVELGQISPALYMAQRGLACSHAIVGDFVGGGGRLSNQDMKVLFLQAGMEMASHDANPEC